MNSKINIQKYRQNGSKMFSGRDLGVEARVEFDLESKDRDDNTYTIVIPDDTYSFGGSFFGGMFSDSVIALGEEKFRRKYTFKFRNCELSESIREDIDEGIYDAVNGLCVG